METKLILTRFGGNCGVLSFDEKSFSKSSLNFYPFWVYEPTNAIYADSHVVYASEEVIKLCTINKILLKCDVIDGNFKMV